jgi:hypothetical protein
MLNPKSKPVAKKIMGDIEVQRGERAYQATGGLYGFFTVFDRVQSAVTGLSMTAEVAQIRNGERLQSEATQELGAPQNR